MARMSRIFVATAIAAGLVSATACGTGIDSDASSSGDGRAATERADDARPGNTDTSEASDGSGADASLITAALEVAADRDIIHTVEVSIDTEDVATATAHAVTIAVDAGGFVASETTRGNDHAMLTLKIPVGAHAGALDDLEALGEVVDRTRTAEDVTDRVVDTESRIESQRASIARTRDLLEGADDIEQIIRIEEELSRREADLDALLRTGEELAELTSLATLEVRFGSADDPESNEDGAGFVTGLRGGWDAFAQTLTVGAAVLGAALPFLLTAALFAVPILWWRRRAHG